MLKPKELRELTLDELKQKLNSIRKELFELNFKAKIGRVEKPSRINDAKRDIARIITIMQEANKTGNK